MWKERANIQRDPQIFSTVSVWYVIVNTVTCDIVDLKEKKAIFVDPVLVVKIQRLLCICACPQETWALILGCSVRCDLLWGTPVITNRAFKLKESCSWCQVCMSNLESWPSKTAVHTVLSSFSQKHWSLLWPAMPLFWFILSALTSATTTRPVNEWWGGNREPVLFQNGCKY